MKNPPNGAGGGGAESRSLAQLLHPAALGESSRLLLPPPAARGTPATGCPPHQVLPFWLGGWRGNKVGLDALGLSCASPATAPLPPPILAGVVGPGGHRVETIPQNSSRALVSSDQALFSPYLVVIWLWAAVQGEPAGGSTALSAVGGAAFLPPPSLKGPEERGGGGCPMPGKGLWARFFLFIPREHFSDGCVDRGGFYCCFGKTPRRGALGGGHLGLS